MNYDSLFQISYLSEIIQVSKNKVTSCEFALAVLFGVRKPRSTARIISIFLQVLISRPISHVQQVDSVSFHPISYGWYALYGIHGRGIHKWRRIASCREGAAEKSHISYTLFAAKLSGLPWYCVTIASCSLPSMSTLSVPLGGGENTPFDGTGDQRSVQEVPPLLFLSSRRQSDPVTGWHHFNATFRFSQGG